MGDRHEDAQALTAKAREAWIATWEQTRWDYWVRLNWRNAVHTATANEHLERLIRDLHRPGIQGARHPTIHVVAGFHAEPYPHAHAVVGLSRRHRMQFLNAEEFAGWLAGYWYHGAVWAELYDPTKRNPVHGGALEYLARDPGTVVWG
jgi:hypothetical protein